MFKIKPKCSEPNRTVIIGIVKKEKQNEF